jgi:hypothetical protein
MDEQSAIEAKILLDKIERYSTTKDYLERYEPEFFRVGNYPIYIPEDIRSEIRSYTLGLLKGRILLCKKELENLK